MTTRTPLMAGNWKMNLDHHQATHLVQKLSWTLADAGHDFTDVEVVVVPPFTSLRSVQTLIDADKLAIGYGAQDISADRKSTRLNSSHVASSYAVFCLKKKTNTNY